MSFEKPLILFREGIADILYGQQGAGGGGTPFVPLASNGVFFDPVDSTFKLGTAAGGSGVPFAVNREINMAGFSLQWDNARFIYQTPQSVTHEYHYNIQTPAIERVFTSSASNLIPFERYVDANPGGGPPDDNIYMEGWNVDSHFNGAKPSWTWRLEYGFTGDLYESHIQFQSPVSGVTYRVISFQVADHGGIATDTSLAFVTVSQFNWNWLNGFTYAGWTYNPIVDATVLQLFTQGGLECRFALDNGTGFVTIGPPFAAAETLLFENFTGGIGFGNQVPGGANCGAIGSTLFVTNFFTTASGNLYTWDNPNNDMFFDYMPHVAAPKNGFWHEHFSNVTGNWEFGFRFLGGYNILFATYDDTWTLHQQLLNLQPTFGQWFVECVFAPSLAGAASINIPDGATVIAPVEGDIWNDGANLKMRIAGVTKTFTLI